MIAYTFDNLGYFTGVTVAQKHPIQKDEWILPAGATFVAAPDSSTYTTDEMPMFNQDSEQWVLVDSPEKIANDQTLFQVMNAEGVYLYEDDGQGKPVLRDQAEVDAETDSIIAARELSESLGDIKNTMDGNIITKAMQITRGTSIESVNAFVQAWHLRANNPGEYVSAGLKVYYAKDSFQLLNDLDTEQKITDYYTAVLVELDLFREQEIATYVAAKTALENP